MIGPPITILYIVTLVVGFFQNFHERNFLLPALNKSASPLIHGLVIIKNCYDLSLFQPSTISTVTELRANSMDSTPPNEL